MQLVELVCEHGHRYSKKGSCRICPACEEIRHKQIPFFCPVSGPARRALESVGIYSQQDLAKWNSKDIAELHGVGPKALQVLMQYGWK